MCHTRSASFTSVAIIIILISQQYVAAQSGSRSSGQIIQGGQVYQGGTIIRGGSSTFPQGSTTIQRGSSTQNFQGGSSTSRVIQQPPSFEQKFWRYLQSSHYRQWSPVPGKTGDAYAGQSPHGAMLRMYLNRTAAGRPDTLPNNSIVIKENFGSDGKTLMAITVMYKTQGYNADAGDWYWIKYRPDGSVDQKQTPNGMIKLSGKTKGCIECHAGAEDGDYVFFNDGR